jgi:site-specific DNA recombinase
VVRLQAEQAKQERQIEKMYEDKLDETIDDAFFKRKADECRAEQARMAAEIERLQKARIAYIDNLAELAQQAGDLFEQQPPHEKRKLLPYVATECKWAKGQVTYRLKPGFEEAREQRAA